MKKGYSTDNYHLKYAVKAFLLNENESAVNSMRDGYKSKKYEAEQLVVQQSQPITHILILIKGSIQSLEEFPNGEIIAFSSFHNPEVFGEMEVLVGELTFRASLVTKEKSEVIFIPKNDYLTLFSEDSQLLLNRNKIILKRLLNERSVSRMTTLMNSRNKVITALLTLCHGKDEKEECDRYSLSITRQELADICGLSIKTINRSIKELAEDGLISIKRHCIGITKTQKEMLKKEISEWTNFDFD